jgi:hypothetical protein
MLAGDSYMCQQSIFHVCTNRFWPSDSQAFLDLLSMEPIRPTGRRLVFTLYLKRLTPNLVSLEEVHCWWMPYDL